MPKAPAKKVKKLAVVKAAKPPVESRELLYPEVSVAIHQSDSALTEEQAKVLMGWDDKDIPEADALLTDIDGKRIICWNNVTNRVFTYSIAKTWMSEILNRRWKLNGETLIVGMTGTAISMQHRLIGLILACQVWRKDPTKWPLWEHEPTLDCIIVYGIDESDDTVNTIDTGKPRSLVEVIARSELFASASKGERLELARITDHAVRMLWHRTGAGINAFAPRRTHGESLAFIQRHERLLECVKHIHAENGKNNQISEHYLSCGYAAALMYLMATSASDPVAYAAVELPTEELLDFSNMEKAEEYWVNLGQRIKSFSPIQEALGTLINTANGRSIVDDRIAVIVKAWQCVLSSQKITEASLQLKYEEDADKVLRLAECPTCGGIDKGDPKDDTEGSVGDAVDPTPAQIEEGKTVIKNGKSKGKSKPKPEVGMTVWFAEGGGHWSGQIVSIDGTNCKVKVKTGKEFIEPLSNAITINPTGD